MLHYQGEKNKTILFIHGLGSRKNDFQKAINFPELTQYNLLSVDLLGHGNSAKPSEFDYSMESQARIILELILKMNYHNNLIVVAHSMGGPIAIILAELLKKKPLGILYAEGNIDFSDCFGSNAIISSGSLDDWLEKNYQKTVAQMLEQMGTKPDSYANSFKQADAKAIYLSAKNLVKISKDGKLLTRLVSLDVPVMPIYGELNKGKFTSEQKIAKKFTIKYISNAGHDMMLSNPKKFYESISTFISGLS
jgi:pimeloyl-ACP methyl ester carboxylesterase